MGLPDSVPLAVPVLFAFFGLMVVLEAARDASSPFPSFLFDLYLFEAAAFGAGVLMLLRARHHEEGRPWFAWGLGTLLWVAGLVVTDFGTSPGAEISSEGCVLLWYPLALITVASLTKSRLRRFNAKRWERWLDGFALVLAAATPLVAALQIGLGKVRTNAPLFEVSAVLHPAFDLLVLVPILGMIAIAAWRIDRVWYLISLGVVLWVVADTLSYANFVYPGLHAGFYYFLWPAGLLLIAYAAWLPRADAPVVDAEQGWRVLLIPVACQLFAIGTQLWALIGTLGDSERIMTIVLLAVVIAQICLRYLRPPAAVNPAAPEI
jgi:hypothetical protein